MKIVRWFVQFLYGSQPAEFQSAFQMAESVQRLRAATVRSVFLSLHRQSAVGLVEEHRVSLQRVIPFFGNSFKPFFVGTFESKSGHVVLRGRFTMHYLVKIFMSIWFGFIGVWCVVALLAVSRHPEAWFFPLIGIPMFGFGVALVYFGKWISRNDVMWLSNVIQGALSNAP